MIPLLVPKPSISVSNWLSVFSRSSLPPRLFFWPRARPMASISSMKMMQGAFCLAVSKRSRTRLAPTPTNISTKSEPASEKKGTCASPATALASSVFPVPGGPTRRAPLGILPPSCVYLAGFLRKWTISSTSSLASCRPATSLKVTEAVSLSKRRALLLPMLSAPPMPPPIALDWRRSMMIQKPMMMTSGRKFSTRLSSPERLSLYCTRARMACSS